MNRGHATLQGNKFCNLQLQFCIKEAQSIVSNSSDCLKLTSFIFLFKKHDKYERKFNNNFSRNGI